MRTKKEKVYTPDNIGVLTVMIVLIVIALLVN